MLTAGSNYDETRQNFLWEIPDDYNIGVDVCDKWAKATPNATALIYLAANDTTTSITFLELRDLSNKLANVLKSSGIERGDRVGILLPQCPEAAYAPIAIYKLGAIAVPLFSLFGQVALEFRLTDAGVCALITDAEGVDKLQSIRHRLPQLQNVFSINSASPGISNIHSAMRLSSPEFRPVHTKAEDPALIIYTSGTTGMPKGALHAHRVLLGHLPGVEMSHDFFPQPGDRFWTPADWAWIGGLLDVLFPSLHHGVPVVAHRFPKFSGEGAFHLMREFGVRNAFIPPTALKMMRAASIKYPSLKLSLRSVASGGEPLGSELLQWGRDVLGVTINEFYGQTECNMVVSSCSALMAPRPGNMGRPVPGHDVRILDVDGSLCPEGVAGSIAVRSRDPVMFVEYWKNPDATRAKYQGDWLITGDIESLKRVGFAFLVAKTTS